MWQLLPFTVAHYEVLFSPTIHYGYPDTSFLIFLKLVRSQILQASDETILCDYFIYIQIRFFLIWMKYEKQKFHPISENQIFRIVTLRGTLGFDSE